MAGCGLFATRDARKNGRYRVYKCTQYTRCHITESRIIVVLPDLITPGYSRLQKWIKLSLSYQEKNVRETRRFVN